MIHPAPCSYNDKTKSLPPYESRFKAFMTAFSEFFTEMPSKKCHGLRTCQREFNCVCDHMNWKDETLKRNGYRNIGSFTAKNLKKVSIIAVFSAIAYQFPPEAIITAFKDKTAYALDYFKPTEDPQSGTVLGMRNPPPLTGTTTETGHNYKTLFGNNGTTPHVLEGFYFASNANNIPEPPLETLAILGKLYLNGTCLRYNLRGHTDNQGSEDSNFVLSQHRADFVKTTMVEQINIPSDAITATGYGETDPLTNNDTKSNRKKNRRVEITCVQ